MSSGEFLLMPALPVALCAASIGIVFFAVALSASTYPGKYAYDPSIGLSGLLTSIGTAAFALPSSGGSFLLSAGKKAFKLLPQLLIIFILLALVLVWNDNDHKILQKFDILSTQTTLPVYHKVIMPTARFSQLTFDMGVCWWDYHATFRNIIIRNVAEVGFECAEIDWQKLVNDTVGFIANTVNILTDFAINMGQKPFKVEIALDFLGNILLDIQFLLDCMCKEMAFVFDIIIPTLANKNLAAALDRAVNTIYQLAYQIINSLIDLFDLLFRRKRSIDDQINRVPKFKNTTDTYCDMAYRLTTFLDDTVTLVCVQFVDGNVCYQYVPQLNTLLGASICFGGRFFGGLLDLFTHVDLIFSTEVQYFRHMELLLIYPDLYNTSNGFQKFFYGFNDTYTNDVGDMLGGLANVTVISAETVQNFTVAILYEFADSQSFQNFVQGYNVTPIYDSYVLMRSGAINLSSQVNQYFGSVVESVILYIETWYGFLYDTINTIAIDSPGQIILYIETKIYPRVSILAQRLQSIFVAIANFIRQFDENNSCIFNIPYFPPPTGPNTNPSGSTVCALANVCEDIGFALENVIEFPVQLFVLVFNETQSSFTFQDFVDIIHTTREWIDGPIFILYQNIRNDLSSFLSSFFGDLDCPCDSGTCPSAPANISTLVRDNLDSFFQATIDVPCIVIYFWPRVFIVALDTGLSTGNVETTLCEVLPMVVDIFGIFASMFKAISNLISCVITHSNSINTFAYVLYNLFFDINNPNSLRNEMCSAIQVLVDFANFIYGFMTQGVFYLLNIIVQESVSIVNTVIDAINDFITLWINQHIISFIDSGVICFINEYIFCYINKIFTIFGCFGTLGEIGLGTWSTELQLCIPAGDLLRIFGLPVGTEEYCLPKYDLQIPFPNVVGPLEDFFTCFEDNLGSSPTCDCNNCGNDQSGAVILTCAQLLQLISAEIPHVSVTVPHGKRNIHMTDIKPSLSGEIPDFSIADDMEMYPQVYKRQVYTAANSTTDGNTLFEVIYQNFSSVICGTLKSISLNASYDNQTRDTAAQNYARCMLSTHITLPLNLLIYGNNTGDWSSPFSFMSFGNFLASTVSFVSKLFPAFRHELGCYMSALRDASAGNYSELINVTYCDTWEEYFTENNLTSTYTYEVGERLQTWRHIEVEYLVERNGTASLSSILSGFISALNYTFNIFFNNVSGFNQTLYQIANENYQAIMNATSSEVSRRDTRMVGNNDGILYTIFVNWTTHPTSALYNVQKSGLNVTRLYNRAVAQRDRIYGWFEWYIGLFMNSNDPQVLRNRAAFGNLRYSVINTYKEYAHLFGYYKARGFHEDEERYLKHERNNEMLMDIAYVSPEFDYENDPTDSEGAAKAWIRSTKMGRNKIKYILQDTLDTPENEKRYIPNPFANTSYGICGIPAIGGGTTCINCTVLFRVLDILTERLFECINMSQYNYDLLQVEFLDPFSRRVDSIFSNANKASNGLFNTVYAVRTGRNYTDEVIRPYNYSRATSSSTTSNSYSFFINPFSDIASYIGKYIIEPFIHKVIGWTVDFETIGNDLKAFFIDNDVAVINSFYYYITMFLDTQISLNCAALSEKGIGLGNLLLTFFVVLGGLIVITVILSRITSSLQMVIAPLWILFPVWIFIINYGMPPTYFPAVPMCLGDDIYKIFLQSDVPCVVWGNVLPGLTQEACPTSEVSYSRSFLDCSAAPYYLDNPWRMLWFTIELMLPQVNQYLLTTDVAAMSWIRGISGMQQLMEFPFPSGGPIPDDFMSCFKLRTPNYYSAFLYFGFLLTATGSLALASILTLLLIGAMVMYIAMLCINVASLMAGDAKGMRHTYTDDADFLFPLYTKGTGGATGTSVATKNVPVASEFATQRANDRGPDNNNNIRTRTVGMLRRVGNRLGSGLFKTKPKNKPKNN